MYSEIVRRPVKLPGERKRAKIVDIIARKVKTHWTAHEVMIESGLIDREGAFYPVKIISDIPDEGDIYIGKYTAGRPEPVNRGGIFLSNLLKKPVHDSKGKEIGKIYDYEIYAGRDPWIVWKVLVIPTGLSPTKRRLRLPTKDIDSIKGDKVTLSVALKGEDE